MLDLLMIPTWAHVLVLVGIVTACTLIVLGLKRVRGPDQIRRIMLGLGAALLVGGWGMTQRTVHILSHESVERMTRYAKQSGSKFDDDIFLGGVVTMAIGAGLIGFAFMRPGEKLEE